MTSSASCPITTDATTRIQSDVSTVFALSKALVVPFPSLVDVGKSSTSTTYGQDGVLSEGVKEQLRVGLIDEDLPDVLVFTFSWMCGLDEEFIGPRWAPVLYLVSGGVAHRMNQRDVDHFIQEQLNRLIDCWTANFERSHARNIRCVGRFSKGQ